MTEQYEFILIDEKLASLEVIIQNLQVGIDTLSWDKPEEDTRLAELNDFIAIRDALIEKRNML